MMFMTFLLELLKVLIRFLLLDVLIRLHLLTYLTTYFSGVPHSKGLSPKLPNPDKLPSPDPVPKTEIFLKAQLWQGLPKRQLTKEF